MSNTPTPAPAGAAPAADAAPKKSRKGLFIIATVAVVLLLGGGAAAYWMYAGASPEQPADAEAQEEEGPGAAVTLEPFVVNLADPGGSRFLRVAMSLIVADEEKAAEVGESAVIKARVRSAILEQLALQHADQLVTPEGKTELKKTIAEHAAHVVEGLEVKDVLFSEFVVQF
jgi:flagellar FliL protein